MSLEEGAINYTDLSPNANIQGHQIGDNTIQLRNLAPGTTFSIIDSGNTTVHNPANTLNSTKFATPNGDFATEPLFIYFCSNSNVLSSTGPYGQYSIGQNTVVQTTGANSGKISLLNSGTLLDFNTSQATISFTVYAPDWGGYYPLSIYIDFQWYLLQENAI